MRAACGPGQCRAPSSPRVHHWPSVPAPGGKGPGTRWPGRRVMGPLAPDPCQPPLPSRRRLSPSRGPLPMPPAPGPSALTPVAVAVEAVVVTNCWRLGWAARTLPGVDSVFCCRLHQPKARAGGIEPANLGGGTPKVPVSIKMQTAAKHCNGLVPGSTSLRAH